MIEGVFRTTLLSFDESKIEIEVPRNFYIIFIF